MIPPPEDELPPDPNTPPGLVRVWLGAMMAPRVAAFSAIATLAATVALAVTLIADHEQGPMWMAYTFVFVAPLLFGTLPRPTAMWRFAALVLGIHLPPVLYAGLDAPTYFGIIRSLIVMLDDGTGAYIFFAVVGLMPPLEAMGAWFHRHELAEATSERGARRPDRGRRGVRG